MFESIQQFLSNNKDLLIGVGLGAGGTGLAIGGTRLFKARAEKARQQRIAEQAEAVELANKHAAETDDAKPVHKNKNQTNAA